MAVRNLATLLPTLPAQILKINAAPNISCGWPLLTAGAEVIFSHSESLVAMWYKAKYNVAIPHPNAAGQFEASALTIAFKANIINMM
jgi:hypothetical protein